MIARGGVFAEGRRIQFEAPTVPAARQAAFSADARHEMHDRFTQVDPATCHARWRAGRCRIAARDDAQTGADRLAQARQVQSAQLDYDAALNAVGR
jgi:hypothetical protein